MIKLIPATSGNVEFWQVNDPQARRIETVQHVNRSGAKVTCYGIGDRFHEEKEFKQGTPVAIVLPIGRWRVESSADNKKWFEVTTLEATVPGGSCVNLILDGATFDVRYGKYTKL